MRVVTNVVRPAITCSSPRLISASVRASTDDYRASLDKVFAAGEERGRRRPRLRAEHPGQLGRGPQPLGAGPMAPKPCLDCGTPIERFMQGDMHRSTYFCPHCQPASDHHVQPTDGG